MADRIRSCVYCLELYPDNFSHQIAHDVLAKNGYQYTGILHDKDHYDDDEAAPLKKPHWHYVVVFPRQKDLGPLARELDVECRFVEPCRNRVGAERYLVHRDHPHKAQYDSAELFGPLADSVRAHLDSGISESDKVMSLLALLDTMPVPCTYRQFLVAACNAGLYSVFRRLGNVLSKVLDEHNGLVGY